MAFWEEPPLYMIERELRRRRPRDEERVSTAPLEEIETEVQAPRNQEAEEDLSPVEKSNFKLQSKEKLQELGQYVATHIFRKIRAKWPKLRESFNGYSATDAGGPHQIRREKSRRSMPMKAKKNKVSLPVSAVLAAFCSPDVNVSITDAKKVLIAIGLSEESIETSCRLFVAKIERELFDDLEENLLLQIHEEVVSDAQLMDVLFSIDREKREAEIEQADHDFREIVNEKMEKNRKLRQIEEKAKKRAIKNNVLFEAAISELQPPKGIIAGPRLEALFQMMVTCGKALHLQRIHEATDILNHHKFLLQLIGEDRFSERYLELLRDPKFLPPPTWEGENRKGVPPPSFFHRISLAGPPTLVFTCRALISCGKGLNGMNYFEVVELLQALAATKLQTHSRMHQRYRRYSAARYKWRVIHRRWKVSHFTAWATYTRMMIEFRYYCLRKIVAWKHYTKVNIKRREYFRISFWPFYVWRRYAVASATANEKAKFLVSRVLPTYFLLKFFRAWKSVVAILAAAHKKADLFRKAMLVKKVHINLVWWRKWSKYRYDLRHSWIKGRFYDVKMRILLNKLSYFQIWKGYAIYRAAVKRRVKFFAMAFRRLLLPEKLPVNSFELTREFHLEVNARKSFYRNQEMIALMRKRAKKEKLARKFEESARNASSLFQRQDLDSDGSNDESDSDSESESDAQDVEAPPPLTISLAKRTRNDLKVMSNWKPHRPHDAYDIVIDAEGNFTSFIPPAIEALYDQCTNPISDVEEHLDGKWGSSFVQQKYSNIRANFRAVEAMALLEEAMVFHRAASRAFRNLQTYAIVRRNARKSHHKQKLRLMRIVFNALFDWMHRVGMTEKSEAEGVALKARAARLGNLQRRREIQKAALSASVDENGITRLSSSDGKVDLLELDREERFDEILHIKRMIALSDSYQQHARVVVEKNMHEPGIEIVKVKREAAKELIAQESAELQAAQDAELEFARQFKIRAAEKIVNVLSKVYNEAQLAHTHKIVRILFRHLRMPLLKKRSIYMRNRAIIKNYIRICKRLNSLSASVHRYKDLRVAWVIFNRWIKLIEVSYLDTTPGLVTRIKRAVELYKSYTLHLRDLGFKVLVYPRSGSLLPATLGYKQLFLRWKMYTQDNKIFRIAEEKAVIVYSVKLLRLCFNLLKYSRREYVLPFVPEVKKCPALVRATMDLDQIIKRFVAVRKVTLYARIGILNRQFLHQMRAHAKRTMTFKGFIHKLNDDVNRRLATEMAVLSDAFEERGALRFLDNIYGNGVPSSMLALPGNQFSDPRLGIETPMVPGGYKMSTVNVCVQEGNGVIGWQILWSGDAAPDINGPKRGKWSGAAIVIHEINIPVDDFVTDVEYYYEGIIIYGIRLHLFLRGWTAWAGGKNSLSTLSLLLSARDAPLPDERNSYDNFDDDPDTAMTKRYIVGFTGLETSFQATGLGIVVRNVQYQHIFSYMWVDEAMQRDAIAFEQTKRQEKLKKEREMAMNRKLKSKATNKLSLPSIIQAKIMSKLSKTSKWTQGIAESLTQATSKVFLNSMEQYFDVTRMRSKEVQGALRRAEDFAIRMWADRDIVLRHPELTGLINLNVISGLTKWYFSVISKRLMPDFPSAAKGTRLILESMQIHNKAEAELRESAATNIHASRLENDVLKKKWENKYLLSPEDRKRKKEHEAEVLRMRNEAMEIVRNADIRDAAAFDMFMQGKAMMPYLKLTRFVCGNYKQKLDAARHKAVLLERMTIEEVKESLAGKGMEPGAALSQESMTVVQSLLAGKKKYEGYTPLDKDAENSTALEVERLKTASRESNRFAAKKTFRKSRSIPNPVDINKRRNGAFPRVQTSNTIVQKRRALSSVRIPPLKLSKEPICDDI